MVRQWQELFYEERYSQVYLGYDVPDYVKLAEAYGAVGLRAERPDDVDTVIEKALSVDDRSVVIDFRVRRGRDVLPDGPGGRLATTTSSPAPRACRPAGRPAEAPIA